MKLIGVGFHFDTFNDVWHELSPSEEVLSFDPEDAFLYQVCMEILEEFWVFTCTYK